MQLLSILLLIIVIFSSVWTNVQLQIGFPIEIIQIGFSPTQYCIGTTCYPYTYIPINRGDVKKYTLHEYITTSWCGCTTSQQSSVVDTIENSIEQEICRSAMELCIYLVILLLFCTLISIVVFSLCLSYWKHEHEVGNYMIYAHVFVIVGHCLATSIWAYFTHPRFKPSLHGEFQVFAVDTTFHFPLYALIANCFLELLGLKYCLELTCWQKRNYLNRLHVRQLTKHPLECPAMYA